MNPYRPPNPYHQPTNPSPQPPTSYYQPYNPIYPQLQPTVHYPHQPQPGPSNSPPGGVVSPSVAAALRAIPQADFAALANVLSPAQLRAQEEEINYGDVHGGRGKGKVGSWEEGIEGRVSDQRGGEPSQQRPHSSDRPNSDNARYYPAYPTTTPSTTIQQHKQLHTKLTPSTGPAANLAPRPGWRPISAHQNHSPPQPPPSTTTPNQSLPASHSARPTIPPPIIPIIPKPMASAQTATSSAAPTGRAPVATNSASLPNRPAARSSDEPHERGADEDSSDENARPRNRGPANATLLVTAEETPQGNVDKTLKFLLGKYGTWVSYSRVRVERPVRGLKLAAAVVEYSGEAEARAAIQALDGMKHPTLGELIVEQAPRRKLPAIGTGSRTPQSTAPRRSDPAGPATTLAPRPPASAQPAADTQRRPVHQPAPQPRPAPLIQPIGSVTPNSSNPGIVTTTGTGSFVVTCAHFPTPPGRRQSPNTDLKFQHLGGFMWTFFYPTIVTAKYAVERQRFRAECEAETRRFHAVAWRWSEREADAEAGRTTLYYDVPVSQVGAVPLPVRPTTGAPITITPTAGPATLIQASAVAPSAVRGTGGPASAPALSGAPALAPLARSPPPPPPPVQPTQSIKTVSSPPPVVAAASAATPAPASAAAPTDAAAPTPVSQVAKRSIGAAALDRLRQGPASASPPVPAQPQPVTPALSTSVSQAVPTQTSTPSNASRSAPTAATASAPVATVKTLKRCPHLDRLPGRVVKQHDDETTTFEWYVPYPAELALDKATERASFRWSCEVQVARWSATNYKWSKEHMRGQAVGEILTFTVPNNRIGATPLDYMSGKQWRTAQSREAVGTVRSDDASVAIRALRFSKLPGTVVGSLAVTPRAKAYSVKSAYPRELADDQGLREAYRKAYEAELACLGAFGFDWRGNPAERKFTLGYAVMKNRIPGRRIDSTVANPGRLEHAEVGAEAEAAPAVERIELPDNCRTGEGRERARDKFQTKQLRRLMAGGNSIRSITWTDTELVITYTLDDDSDDDSDSDDDNDVAEQPAKEIDSAAERHSAPAQRIATPPPPPLPLFAPHEATPVTEDRKPRIERSPSLEVTGFEPARGPVQQNLGPLPEFPFAVRGSSSDESADINRHALEFINTFFPKFDANRQTLVDLYTQDALFSVVGEVAEPAQLVHARPRPLTTPIPGTVPKRFERVWYTPAQIINAFTQIPAGSHERKKIRYDAHALPELADWPGAKRPPLVVHVQAEFEHFPEKVRRRVSRVFVLVPKDVRRGGGACPIEYQIKSDQLTFGYFVPNKKGRMDNVKVLGDEWRLLRPTVPVPLASPPRVATAPARVPVPVNPTAPAAALPAARAQIIASPPAPNRNSDDDSDDDMMIVEEVSQMAHPPPTRRRTPSPAPPPPAPAAVPAPPPTVAKAKKANKRPASSPAGQPRAAPASSARKRIETDSVAAVAASAGVGAEVFTPAQQAAVEALIQQRLQAAFGVQQAVPAPDPSGSSTAGPSSRRVSRNLAPTSPVAGSSPGTAPASLAPVVGAPQTGRLIRTGSTTYFTHGYTGVGNKMRELYSLGDLGGFLALSSQGDVVRWDGRAREVKRVSTGAEVNKVESGGYSAAWQTLVVGYMGLPAGAPGVADDVLARRPAHQVSLVQLSKTVLPGQRERTWQRVPITEAPHATGVTTVAVQPMAPNKRLKWVTGGEDKDFYHWTWHASSKKAVVDRLRLGHTSAAADLSFSADGEYLLSAGNDKRVICFDLHEKKARWTATLEQRAVMVSAVPGSTNLVLSRQGLANNQFTLHDLRSHAPAARFGFDVAFTRNTQGQMVQQNLGRFLRGDWRDALFVHPDGQQGVHLWDVRSLRARLGEEQGLGGGGSGNEGEVAGQEVPGVGGNKVVSALWTGDGGLALLGLHGVAKVGVAQFY